MALGTFLLYARVYNHEFVNYDDPDYVTRNPIVQKGISIAGCRWAFTQLHGEYTYWHPITWLSHMLDCQLFGLNPGAHHLVNVLFHVVNACLVFLVFRTMTANAWLSWITAAAFSVHPLQVDTVAWVTERKNLLSGMFWLLTILAYVAYARRSSKVQAPGSKDIANPKFQLERENGEESKAERRPGDASLSPFLPCPIPWYALALLFFALGLMSKPVLVTLPFALLLLDYWPLSRFKAGDAGLEFRAVTRLIIEKLPFLALAAVSSYITIRGHASMGMLGSENLPLAMRLQNAVVSYARYLGKVFFPDNLAVFYPHPGWWPAWQVIGSAILLLAITGLVLWRIRAVPALAVGWFWFLGVLVPTIGVLQASSQSMADRFSYLPLIGLLIAATWGGWRAAQYLGLEQVAKALTGVALTLMAICTNIQLSYWRNTYTLFHHAAEVTPGNFVAYGILGTELSMQGRRQDATDYFDLALKFSPDYPYTHIAIGDHAFRAREYGKAVESYRKGVDFEPASPRAHMKLCAALESSGRLDEAAAAYREGLKYHPQMPELRLGLGNVLLVQGRFAEALQHYREAIRLAPNWPDALNRVSWLLATHGDAKIRNGPEALVLARRACELTKYENPQSLNALAAAHAENGQFAEAVQISQRAIELASNTGQGPLAAIIQKLQEGYKAGQPYREGVQ